MSETRRGRLVGFGPMRWQDARDLLDGYHAVWVDLDGWHVAGDPLPEDQPTTTHVWAWHQSSGWWARLRLEGDTAIVGILKTESEEPGFDGALVDEDVDYTVSRGVPWGDERQIPPRGDSVRYLPFEIAEVVGLSPIMFARLDGRS